MCTYRLLCNSNNVDSLQLENILLQVLSPLSDSILAEKTVTVLDDKVK